MKKQIIITAVILMLAVGLKMIYACIPYANTVGIDFPPAIIFDLSVITEHAQKDAFD